MSFLRMPVAREAARRVRDSAKGDEQLLAWLKIFAHAQVACALLGCLKSVPGSQEHLARSERLLAFVAGHSAWPELVKTAVQADHLPELQKILSSKAPGEELAKSIAELIRNAPSP